MQFTLLTVIITLIVNNYEANAAIKSTIDHSVLYCDNRTYESEITSEHLTEHSKWDHRNSKLPLYPGGAEIIAVDYATTNLGKIGSGFINGRSWVTTVVSLKNVRGTDYWYYDVAIEPVIAGTGGRNSISVFVKMDRKVIPKRILTP